MKNLSVFNVYVMKDEIFPIISLYYDQTNVWRAIPENINKKEKVKNVWGMSKNIRKKMSEFLEILKKLLCTS